tara:strand:- start:223 stop:1101 length:879 start_codon:yes stop_codon:yes gene_type:complete
VKPKLLLSAGLPASGSTSLYYTVWNNKYAHGGAMKESNYLLSIEFPEKFKQNNEDHKNKKGFGMGVDRLWVMPSEVFDSSFIEDVGFNALCSSSLEKYINYNLKLWETVKDNFESVTDFSNSNRQLTEKFMMSIRDELLKYFDIKVVMIFRDPIRMVWSACNRRSKLGEGLPESIIEQYFYHPNVRYVDLYERYVRVWGKDRVKFIINEDFYKGDMQPLSKFLEFPISPTYKNITHLSSLKEKVYSQWCDLGYETWKYAYENMKWVYDDFENNFGYMPSDWGKWYIAVEKPK